MPTAGVLQRIERVMVDAAKAVAGGVGYAFQVPSRTDVKEYQELKNQMEAR